MVSDRTFSFPEILDSASIGPLADKLRPIIGLPSGIFVDGSNVKRVSTAALQFLVAIAKQTQVDGGHITIVKPSEALSKAVALLGLEREFSRCFKGWEL